MTMHLGEVLQGLLRTATRTWPQMLLDIEDSAQQSARGRHRAAMDGWGLRLPTLCIATPQIAGESLLPLVPVAARGIPAEQGDVQKYGRVMPTQARAIDAANALDCVGITLSSDAWRTCRAWLPPSWSRGIPVRTTGTRLDDDDASYWWSAGFAALALDEPQRFHIAAGLLPDEPNPFTPGAVFQFNLQGLLRHLAAAIATRARFEAVRPAWENFLHCYGDLRQASSVDQGTLLWVGRIVFHRIGGVPLGDVAQAIHDSAWTLAGLDPERDDKGASE